MQLYIFNDLIAAPFCTILVDLPEIIFVLIEPISTIGGIICIASSIGFFYSLYQLSKLPKKPDEEKPSDKFLPPLPRRIWRIFFADVQYESKEAEEAAAKRAALGWKNLAFAKKQEYEMKKSMEFSRQVYEEMKKKKPK